jgi:hypothetical protein
MKKTFLNVISFTMAMLLASCGGSPTPSNNSQNSQGGQSISDVPSTDPSEPSVDPSEPSTPSVEPDPSNQDFTGITMENSTVIYDGAAHTIKAVGVPDFASTLYSNQGPFTNVGTYAIACQISAKGYNTLNLSATLRITEKAFENITMDNSTVTHDGVEHSIAPTNVPDFATVVYDTAIYKFSNVGQYTIGCTVKASNYNDYHLSAILTISKADITGPVFESAIVEFDTREHSIYVAGQLPLNATVTYTSNVSGITNTAVDVGKYVITATIKAPNYNDKVLSATLYINATDDSRSIFYYNSNLYFQNALDNDKLYSYNGTNVSKINNDRAQYIQKYDNNIVYSSKSSFLSSLKSMNLSSNAVTILDSANAQYLQTVGNMLFYVVNGFTDDSSGIYSLDLSNTSATPTLLSKGQAKYLQFYNGVLVFADGANGWKLSTSATTAGARTLLVDEKINALLTYDGYAYFTVDNLLGNYLAKVSLTDADHSVVKLTTDAGTNLQVIGNYLYYVNVDIFTISLIGKGIFKVPTNGSRKLIAGEQVIAGSDSGVCSLYNYDNDLYYYDCDGYKLMKYNLSTENSVNILSGFVTPEYTPTSFGGHSLKYGNFLYYLDIYDGKTLFAYNTKSGAKYKITSNKVQDFSIIGDYLYFNLVSKLVDNDLYRVNLKTAGDPEWISEYSAKEMVSDGTHLYFVEENAGGVDTAIHQCDLDGKNDAVIYDKGAYNLRIANGKIYFIINKTALLYGYINYLDLSSPTLTSETKDTPVKINDLETSAFEINDGYIYFRELYGIGWANKRLSKVALDGTTGYIVLDNVDVDPIELIIDNGYIYYFSYTESKLEKSGLYKISITGTNRKKLLDLVDTTDYYASALAVVGSNIYFLNYYLGGALGDSHTYSLSTSASLGTAPTKIA